MIDPIYSMKREMLRRGLSHRTIRTYAHCVNRFFRYCRKEPRKVTKKDVREYLDRFIDKGTCGNTINVHHNAIKFFFEETLRKSMFIKIRYHKIPKEMPVVLSKREVKLLIDNVHNSKHKLMIKLMYSAGLRVSELVSLKVRDLEFEQGLGWVRKGKGRKDRRFIIAESIKDELGSFVSGFGHDSYIFRGNKGFHLHQRSVQEIVKQACRKSGIRKKVHPHTLRHSFATHLIENGYDVNSVQSLLGHSSAETTMVYVHMASPKMINVKSPLDNQKLYK